MLNIFASRSPTLLGFDISASTVKMLELQRKNDRYCVECYSVIPLPPDTFVDRSIKDVDAVTYALKQALQNSKTKATCAAASVPDSAVITKVIQLDASLSEEDVEVQIAVEADKYIPYPLEEVSLDFDIIRPNKDNPELNDVLLVASRTENVDTRAQAFEAAGLDLKVIDVESYAIERAITLAVEQLPNHGQDEIVAVFDIGASVTTLTVLHNMSTIFFREEVFGGSQLTRAIQNQFGLSYQEAGYAKKAGGLPDSYESDILKPFMDSAVLQVRRSLQFFFSSSSHNKVSQIVLAGGTAAIAGMPMLIEEQIGIPTRVANPFVNMEIHNRIDKLALTKDASALMIACGLAMRSFD